MSFDLEISLPPPPPFLLLILPPSSERDSFLEISLHGEKDGPYGSSISRAHSQHNRESFHISPSKPGSWTKNIDPVWVTHPSFNQLLCPKSWSTVIGQLECMCLLWQTHQSHVVWRKVIFQGKKSDSPPKKVSIIMANLFLKNRM